MLLQPAHEALHTALADAQHAAGVAAHGAGRLEAAEVATRRSLELRSVGATAAAAYSTLGLILLQRARSSSLPPPHTALAAFRAAVSVDPHAGDAYYSLGNTLRALGRTSDAVEAYEQGLAAMPRHAGLRSSLGFALLDADDDTRRARGHVVLRGAEARSVWRHAAPWQLPADFTPIPNASSSFRPTRFVALGPRAETASADAPWADRMSRDGTLSRGWGCVLAPLEEAADSISLEAMSLLGEFRIQHEGIATPRDGWRELELMSRCRAHASSSAVDGGLAGAGADASPGRHALTRTCDALAALEQTIGGRMTLRGAAFSALSPGTRLMAHCGTTNRRLTLHLGLSIPQPGAAVLRVGRPTNAPEDATNEADDGIDYAWVRGGAMVWDDSFAHEVFWRHTPAPSPDDAQLAPRVILLLTLAHPAFVEGAVDDDLRSPWPCHDES